MKSKIFLKPGAHFIRLDDLLKISGETTTGGQAKILIQSGKVKLNGKICNLRGKKLVTRDVVSIAENSYEVEEVTF